MGKRDEKNIKFSPEVRYLPGDVPTYVLELGIMNWDEEYKNDIKSGIGFDITDYTPLKDKKRTPNGIFSNKFGSELSDDVTVSDRFSCDCKELKGAYLEGEVCPHCGSKVRYFNSDILKTGWFTTNFKFINPHFYEFLSSFIGSKKLLNMVKRESDTDKNGIIIIKEKNEKDETPFDSIGVVEFHDRFDEIMEYALQQNPKKEDTYNFIMKHRDAVFINHFPLYSLNLRPFTMKKNNVRFADINRKFMVLSTNFGKINKKKEYTELEVEKLQPLIYETQALINDIYMMNMDMIVGKEGHIRSKMVAARVNFSSRCVIVPSSTSVKINEIILPYLAFLEMYKFRIINVLCKTKNMTIPDAEKRWFNASLDYDKEIYLIMKMLVEKSNSGKGLYHYLNRNPTLQFGSKLLVKIKDVKEDIDDFTLTISNYLLKCLSGDYDGDVLNLFTPVDYEEVKEMHIFDPREMIIANGKFNRNFTMIKDQIVGLVAFNTPSEMEE